MCAELRRSFGDPVDAEIGDEALQLEAVNRFVLARPFGSYRQIS